MLDPRRRAPGRGAGGPCTQHHTDSLAILHRHRSCALNGTAEDGVGLDPGVAQALIRGLRRSRGAARGACEQTAPTAPLQRCSQRAQDLKKLVTIREESRDLFQFVFPGTALQPNTPVSAGGGGRNEDAWGPPGPPPPPRRRGLCASPTGIPLSGSPPAASRPCQPARPTGRGGL